MSNMKVELGVCDSQNLRSVVLCVPVLSGKTLYDMTFTSHACTIAGAEFIGQGCQGSLALVGGKFVGLQSCSRWSR